MDALGWLAYLGLALMVGACGQLVRVAVGLKKLRDKNAAEGTKTAFDAKRFWISMVLGAFAAVLAALFQSGGETHAMDRDFIFTLLVAGYAGSDFIEGFMGRQAKATS